MYATQTQKRMDGPWYYSIVTLIGMIWSYAYLKIPLIAVSSWLNPQAFANGILTAAGALFFNRVVVPWGKKKALPWGKGKYEKWRDKKLKKNDEQSQGNEPPAKS